MRLMLTPRRPTYTGPLGVCRIRPCFIMFMASSQLYPIKTQDLGENPSPKELIAVSLLRMLSRLPTPTARGEGLTWHRKNTCKSDVHCCPTYSKRLAQESEPWLSSKVAYPVPRNGTASFHPGSLDRPSCLRALPLLPRARSCTDPSVFPLRVSNYPPVARLAHVSRRRQPDQPYSIPRKVQHNNWNLVSSPYMGGQKKLPFLQPQGVPILLRTRGRGPLPARQISLWELVYICIMNMNMLTFVASVIASRYLHVSFI